MEKQPPWEPQICAPDDLSKAAATLKNDIPFLNVRRLSDKATLPKRMFPYAAGYDLFSAIDIKVPARGKAKVPTDLIIDIPQGAYGRIAGRSGLAWEHSIDVGGGVLDADKNPVFVILYNHSNVDFEVKVGDGIAQMVIELNATPEIWEIHQ
ncbi:deoxyuridine 5'-triphosphate nucleotidohydrolase-like [Olea europaea var. sylvestris]|uniref:deoxyuridine 5'-triphosphate nucleotidohydrolase-like n=1 Tax=Olea europaea var. sylvestris TaxID=158386 RepID=UPI000C1D5602|nr:deoxyuridine 5'-triphosphate nucleotidohydrolase-like [Olea europaea var. sylvestris]